MISPIPPTTFLAQIAAQSAATWHAAGGRMFLGIVTIETGNRTYTFEDGVFVRRTSGSSEEGSSSPLSGMRLVGFLAEEGGFWSLTTRWRTGSHAVMWRPSAAQDGAEGEGGETIDPKSFLLTSATSSFTVAEPEPQPWIAQAQPAPHSTAASSQSGVRARRPARPPSIARPSPASMTRLHASAAVLPTVIIT